MPARPESFLAPDQGADKSALEKESEHALHGERLSDHAACVFGKVRPVRSELELHRNSGDDADREIKSKDFGPKPNGLIVFLVAGPKRAPFPVNNEPRQPHRELREQVVINEREPELQPVPKPWIVKDRVHGGP